MRTTALLVSAIMLAFMSASWAGPGNEHRRGGGVDRRVHDNQVNTSEVCKSGSRVFEFDYDPVTGTLIDDVTFDNCTLANGTTVSGSTSTDGTLLETAPFTYSINLTDTVDTTTTDRFGNVHTRKCTIVRDGTLDTQGFVFTGTITRTDCSTSGSFREPGSLLQHLLKKLTRGEEDDDEGPDDNAPDNDDSAH